MMIPYRPPPLWPDYRRGGAIRAAGPQRNEDPPMKWETPVAVDFRFGMEITMYVSNR